MIIGEFVPQTEIPELGAILLNSGIRFAKFFACLKELGPLQVDLIIQGAKRIARSETPRAGFVAQGSGPRQALLLNERLVHLRLEGSVSSVQVDNGGEKNTFRAAASSR